MNIHLKSLRAVPFLLCVVMVLQPTVSLSAYPMLLPLSYLIQAMSLLGCLFMALVSMSHPRFSLYALLVALHFFLLILFTVLRGNDIRHSVFMSANVLLLILLFHYYSHRTRLLLLALAAAFSAAIYAAVLQILIFPQTLFASDNAFTGFLLGGNYNQMGCRLLCGILCSALCARYHWLWRVNTVAIILFSVAALSVVGSMTSLSGILILVALALIPSRRLHLSSLAAFFILYLLFHVIVVFSGEALHNNDLARYVIEDLLGKDMTFTNRTGMWDAALRLISRSPLFGYGYVDHEWYLSNMSTFAIGPHNQVLATLIFGGPLLLAVYIAAFATAVWRTVKSRPERTGTLILSGIITLLFMMTFEYYDPFFIFLLFTLAWPSPEIVYTHRRLSAPSLSTSNSF